jgi:hypothetical protein
VVDVLAVSSRSIDLKVRTLWSLKLVIVFHSIVATILSYYALLREPKM